MADIKFPTAPEVCLDCRTGKHVMHVISELGDLHAWWEVCDEEGRGRKILFLHGHAEDELFLEDLLRVLHLSYIRMSHHEKECDGGPSNFLPVPIEQDDECPNCHLGTVERVGEDLYTCRGECGAFFRGPRRS